MIFNPQILDKVDYEKDNFDTIKNPIFFSLQYWKSSKHVDDLIRAVPHVHFKNPEASFLLGGGGMEYYYMASKDKIKDKYIINRKNDPDIGDKYIGQTILNVAKQYNAELLFWLSAKDRDVVFQNSTFFVDTAYYTISEKLGEHFSRTLIEAMMNGVVPIGRNLGLSNNKEGIGSIFKPDENYLMIPSDATPKQFANRLIDAIKIDVQSYKKIIKNNYKLLKHFDVEYVCKQYIDVIESKPTGWFNKYETGKADKKFIEKASKTWFGDGTKRDFNFKR
jgi:glycosyltransferase involved in cell wall biosynthesis